MGKTTNDKPRNPEDLGREIAKALLGAIATESLLKKGKRG